jgi:hypothetical protein
MGSERFRHDGGEPDYRRVHARHRPERAASHAEQAFGSGDGLYANGERAVLAGARRRNDTVGHLALDHQHDALRPCGTLEQAEDDRRRDVVRDVADHLHLVRVWTHGMQVQAHEVGVHDSDVRLLFVLCGQCGSQRVIELHEDQATDARGQVPCERTLAGPDLEHGIGRRRLQRRDDAPLLVRVDQEVLAE